MVGAEPAPASSLAGDCGSGWPVGPTAGGGVERGGWHRAAPTPRVCGRALAGGL